MGFAPSCVMVHVRPTYHSRPVSANAKSTAFYSEAQNEAGYRAERAPKQPYWPHLGKWVGPALPEVHFDNPFD